MFSVRPCRPPTRRPSRAEPSRWIMKAPFPGAFFMRQKAAERALKYHAMRRESENAPETPRNIWTSGWISSDGETISTPTSQKPFSATCKVLYSYWPAAWVRKVFRTDWPAASTLRQRHGRLPAHVLQGAPFLRWPWHRGSAGDDPYQSAEKAGTDPDLRRKTENLSVHAVKLAVSGAHLNRMGRASASEESWNALSAVSYALKS